MIKVIALDLVGVLVHEKDNLNDVEDQVERLFGPNISDEEFINKAVNITNDDIVSLTKNIINKLYYVDNKNIFNDIKKLDSNIKIIIATNHVSYIKDFINNNFDITNLDEIIISSDIHMIKPNHDFYEYILNKYNIKADELLFIDDSIININSANNIGINTIKVNKDSNIINEIKKNID